MTHSELVERAARWLRKRCAVTITEMSGQRVEPDALGFGRGISIFIECKASRADFCREKYKASHRTDQHMGTLRYYMAPKGLLKQDDLPEGWGLLEVAGQRIRQAVKAEAHNEKDWRSEQGLLVSALRRIGEKSPRGTYVRFYPYAAPRNGHVPRATLGVSQKSDSETK